MTVRDNMANNKTNAALRREIDQHIRMEEQLEIRNKLLSTLLDVSNLVSSTLDLKPLLEGILDRLKKIIDYNSAKIFIIEEDMIRVVAHRSSMTDEEAEKYFFYYRRLPLVKEIIDQKKPIVISDLFGDEKQAVEFRTVMEPYLETTLANTGSWMGLPLVVKDRVIGVLTINHYRQGYYLNEHIDVCLAFANQVAIEFENARLYNQTAKRADELNTMLSVQQAITSRLDLNSVLQLVADEARRLTGCERAGVFLVEGKEMYLSVFSGAGSKALLGYRMSIDNTVLGQTIVYGKPMIVNHAQGNPVISPGLVEMAGVRSFLSVPLITEDKKIGVIVVVDKITGEFRREDESFLNMLASTAIIGIENARMYEDERKRHREDEQRRRVAEGLRDILAILNSVKPLEEILNYIMMQAVKLLGTDTGSLYKLCSEERVLRIEAAAGLSQEYMQAMDIPLGKGVIGKAVRDRKPIAVPDLKSAAPEEFMNDPLKRPHMQWLLDRYRGMMAVPVICKDEIYGGIILYYKDKTEFIKEEVDLAMTFADQVALAIDNSKLRARAEELAVAAERSRLARDLHDAVTQTLFSASLIAEVLPRIWDKSQAEGRKRLDELRQLTRGALAEMRTLLLELRPATLVEAKIEELFKHLAEAVTGRARIPVELSVDSGITVPTDVKIAFYRIAQEALNNIIKHSDAERVSLAITGSVDCVSLKVEDDGCGFDITRVKGDHQGLVIMKERAVGAGLDIEICSSLNEGTKIEVKWENRGENC